MPAWSEVLGLIGQYGWPAVLLAVLIYMVLFGQIEFRYPRQDPPRRRR